MVGAGGMGQVYRARDRVLERTVAVKVLSAASTDEPELVARFGREARAAAAALNHPNIVAVFDSGADGDLHYLVMEYVEGQGLAGLLRREGRLGPRRVAEVGRQVCQALAAAHAAGLVHRDITPGNVLVDPAGLVKVADFGIAKLAAATTMTGDEVRDSPVAVAARHVTEQPTPPSHHNSRVGPALEAVVLTALAKEPADRYQSATAMAQYLERVVTDAGSGDMPLPCARGEPPTNRLPSVISTSSAATAKTASPALRRPGWIPWALVGTVGVIALVVALWLRDGDPPATPPATTASTAAPPTRPAQGSIDNSAEDLLQQAEEALRAAQE
jgi:eukaryotic-like serine/threonine-protein kinase